MLSVNVHMPNQSRRKTKSGNLAEDQKAQKGIKPITACFSHKSKEKVKSPEYKMSARNTRNSNKDQLDEVSQGEVETEIKEPEVYSGVLPCPELINEDEFNALNHVDQMEKIVAMVNQLCSKVTEMDVVINHDSDGLVTKLETVQTQLDKNTDKIKVIATSKELQQVAKDAGEIQKDVMTLKENITAISTGQKVIKGLLQKHTKQLSSVNSKVAMLTAKSMEMNITISGIENDRGEG